MEQCEQCKGSYPELKACGYCQKRFCSDCYIKHMSWELRHKDLAEDASKLWKRKRHQEGLTP